MAIVNYQVDFQVLAKVAKVEDHSAFVFSDLKWLIHKFSFACILHVLPLMLTKFCVLFV